MNVALDQHWQAFVEDMVRTGRYGSAREVVDEGLRLVQVREAKLQELRDSLNQSIADGEQRTPEEIDAEINAWIEKAKANGY